MIKYRGVIILNPCTYCYRREQDPEAGPGMCWACYVASLLMEVDNDA
jgi:hypothetical protein